jgi:hypothetical protein
LPYASASPRTILGEASIDALSADRYLLRDHRYGQHAFVTGALSFDPERSVELKSCDACGRGYTLVKSFLFDDDEPHAVLFAALHDHGEAEAWIDVILGTFGTEDFTDHVTFGCRVGPVDGQEEPAATLVNAARPYGDSPLFGRKLARDEAIAHTLLPGFWRVVDFVLVSDPDVHFHVYG